jgi:hypothetical protein
MTPKEKAKELFDKMFLIIENKGMYDDLYNAKQCALITVAEILDVITGIYDYDFEKLNPYWEEVKKEIDAL